MKARVLLVAGIGLLLGLLAVGFGARVASYFPAARAEVGRIRLIHLSESLREKLGELRDDVFITYYGD